MTRVWLDRSRKARDQEATMTAKDLDAFLASARPPKCGPQCKTCEHKAAPVIEAFLDKKKAGLTHVSLEYLREQYLSPVLGFDTGRTALYRHVKLCLKRDPITGKPLRKRS